MSVRSSFLQFAFCISHFNFFNYAASQTGIKLQTILKSSENEWKVYEQHMKGIADSLANAQKFIQLHRQLAPRQKQYVENMKNAKVRLAEIAAEASVYEDDLKEAKKKKDKQKIKDLEKKLKTLKTSFDAANKTKMENRDNAVGECKQLETAAKAINPVA